MVIDLKLIILVLLIWIWIKWFFCWGYDNVGNCVRRMVEVYIKYVNV